MDEPATPPQDYIILRNAPFLIQKLAADVAERIANDWLNGAERGAYPAFDEAGTPFLLLVRPTDILVMTHDRLAWEHVNDRTTAADLATAVLAP